MLLKSKKRHLNVERVLQLCCRLLLKLKCRQFLKWLLLRLYTFYVRSVKKMKALKVKKIFVPFGINTKNYAKV